MKEKRDVRAKRLPGWDDERWALRFAELQEFREAHGHSRVPARWRGNMPLGRWVVHQRELYRWGQIEPDRQKRLEKLGMEWSIPEVHSGNDDAYMERMLARLEAYRKQYGHAGVTDERDHRLARWIVRQRSYRNAGVLKKYRCERLDAAGFPWEAVDCRWEEQFARLLKFRERFGHARVARQWKEDNVLGRWVAHLRELHRAGKVPPERRRRLDEVGFEWEVAPDGGPVSAGDGGQPGTPAGA
ncbi:MAG: helicase associated domain-containing protein [Chthoniobacteraceae bacterium]